MKYIILLSYEVTEYLGADLNEERERGERRVIDYSMGQSGGLGKQANEAIVWIWTVYGTRPDPMFSAGNPDYEPTWARAKTLDIHELCHSRQNLVGTK